MINNDALSAVLKGERCVHPQPPRLPPRSANTVHSACPLEVCQPRGLSKLSFDPGRFCLQMCYCVLQDLQQNGMLVNQNLNSNVGLPVHLREAICSNSWIIFLWNQDGKYQLGRSATVLQINLEVEKVQIGFTEFAKSLQKTKTAHRRPRRGRPRNYKCYLRPTHLMCFAYFAKWNRWMWMTRIKEYVKILLDGCDFSKDYIKEIEKTEREGSY